MAMKILAYIKTTLGVNASEFMAFKKQMTDEQWEAFKADGRRDAEASGVELED